MKILPLVSWSWWLVLMEYIFLLTSIAREKDWGSVTELICNWISTVLNAEIDGWQCNRGNIKCQLHWQSKKQRWSKNCVQRKQCWSAFTFTSRQALFLSPSNTFHIIRFAYCPSIKLLIGWVETGLETGVKSDTPFCWGLSLGKTNSGFSLSSSILSLSVTGRSQAISQYIKHPFKRAFLPKKQAQFFGFQMS